MKPKKTVKRRDPKRAALVRALRSSTGHPEKSIYRWLANGGPVNPVLASHWKEALAAADASVRALGLTAPKPAKAGAK